MSAVKFLQRVILVQTRGISDPRVSTLSHLRLKPSDCPKLQKQNDPNISFCAVDHPFISVIPLETEGQRLLEAMAALLYTSQ